MLMDKDGSADCNFAHDDAHWHAGAVEPDRLCKGFEHRQTANEMEQEPDLLLSKVPLNSHEQT